jgi:hypothetical protein
MRHPFVQCLRCRLVKPYLMRRTVFFPRTWSHTPVQKGVEMRPTKLPAAWMFRIQGLGLKVWSLGLKEKGQTKFHPLLFLLLLTFLIIIIIFLRPSPFLPLSLPDSPSSLLLPSFFLLSLSPSLSLSLSLSPPLSPKNLPCLSFSPTCIKTR